MQHYILGLLLLLGLATVQARPQSDDGDEGSDKLAEFVQNNPDYAEALQLLGVDQDELDAISEAAENKTPVEPTVAKSIAEKIAAADLEGEELVGGWGKKLLRSVAKAALQALAVQVIG